MVRKKTNHLLLTFKSAFIYTSLVATNTYLITHLYWIGVFVVSCLISLLWAYNVSKVAISKPIDKFVYAFGAGCGAITGLLILQYILKL